MNDRWQTRLVKPEVSIEHSGAIVLSVGDDYRLTMTPVAAARLVEKLTWAIGKLPACEHGVSDGDYCEPCNAEHKRAARENGD